MASSNFVERVRRLCDEKREHSTLGSDAFLGNEFNFLLPNLPHGKSWPDRPGPHGRQAHTNQLLLRLLHDLLRCAS